MKTIIGKSPRRAELEHIDPKWTWHHEALLELRQKLLRSEAEHEQSASATAEAGGVDAAEVAQEESDHEVILAELHAEENRLAEIDAALQRIRTGRYGVCEETGAPISAARLRAIPWTRFSRAAAERLERRSR